MKVFKVILGAAAILFLVSSIAVAGDFDYISFFNIFLG